MKPYVKIVRAVDRYDVAHEFALKHLSVLESHGVEGVTSMKPSWKYNPFVYVIAMYHPVTETMIAGLRVEIASDTNKLPFELALSDLPSNVTAFVDGYRRDGGVVELAGLWVDRAYGKLNFPTQLTNYAIGLTKQLDLQHVFAFANNYSRPLTEKIGFSAKEINGQQVFLYPDERYPTQLMHIDCTYEVEKAALVATLL